MHHELKPADAIFALGSHDITVAERAAELFLEGYAPYIIFAGDSGEIYSGIKHFAEPEANVFAAIALKMGIPNDRILIEKNSTNTEQNITFVRKLLKEKGLDFNSFILVQKPYMERRTYATFRKFWPEAVCLVTSPLITYEDYKVQADKNNKDFIGALVGDLQRIKLYPAKGFQIPQAIPDPVWMAFERLVELGHTRRLINN